MPSSAALLDGQTVQTTYLFPTTSTVFSGPVNSVVGPGVELPNFAGLANIDISDTNVTITLTRNANVNTVAFDGIRFTDVNGTIPQFTNVILNPATNYAGFDVSRITFSTTDIFVNLANLPGLSGQLISIDFEGGTSSVPEPGTAGLILLGTSVLAARVGRDVAVSRRR